MNASEYQQKARETSEYPAIDLIHFDYERYDFSFQDVSYLYLALGLSGEVGEVLERIKKVVRNKNGVWEPEDYEALKKELGDVFWYGAVLGAYFDLDLSDILKANLDKLADRKQRGVIRSEGDNR